MVDTPDGCEVKVKGSREKFSDLLEELANACDAVSYEIRNAKEGEEKEFLRGALLKVLGLMEALAIDL